LILISPSGKIIILIIRYYKNMTWKEMISGTPKNNDQIRTSLLEDEKEITENNISGILGPEYSIVIKNGKKHLLKNGKPTMVTGYDVIFIRDGGVWGRLGINEDLIISPEKIIYKEENETVEKMVS